MSSDMDMMVDGTHTGFLRHLMGKQARQNPYRKWLIPAVVEVLGELGILSVAIYIGQRKGKLAKWVILRPIF